MTGFDCILGMEEIEKDDGIQIIKKIKQDSDNKVLSW